MTAQNVPGAGYRRRELAGCLPLSTPFALHIFPSHRCNLKCGYCLHSLESRTGKSFRKGMMDFALFTKCVEDASRFPERLKVLILAGWGEPLTHPRIAEMVEFAKRKNIAERVEIVSNGVLLTPELSDRLIDAGLDRIRISIQGIDAERCREVAGVDIDFEALVDNIRHFHENRRGSTIFVKTVDAAVPTEADLAKFQRIFGSICDEIAVEQVIPVISEIDHAKFGTGLNKRHCGGEATRVSVCPFPFYMAVIHPDGSYAPCCSPDLPLQLGNVAETALTELWHGQALQLFRAAQLSGRRGDSAECQGCPRPQYDIQQGDNLDQAAAGLLSLYPLNTEQRTTS
jgi:MoaA/NifB/PqqE/SkfB family radical SAM enzyme